MIELYWWVMGAGFVAYALTAGADFGGGVWDLLASGKRKEAQRTAIEHAIAPIWEANHVWLIFVIVVLFTVFPRGFAAIATALHVPLTLALIGIVLRGAAFTFRAYGLEPPSRRAAWGRVFAWSSSITPVVLGLCLAALASGEITLQDNQVTSGYFAGWLSPFAFATGLFSLVLFSMLAAVYLTAETRGAVQRDFRARALAAEMVAAALALITFWRASIDAPVLFAHLAGSPWTWPVQLATFAAAFLTMHWLLRGKFRRARWSAATQVALVIAGWGLAMDQHLILPALPMHAAGTRQEILGTLAPALLAGAALLVPSLWFLFRVFKLKKAA